MGLCGKTRLDCEAARERLCLDVTVRWHWVLPGPPKWVVEEDMCRAGGYVPCQVDNLMCGRAVY